MPGDLQTGESPHGDWTNQDQVAHHSDPHGSAAYFAWTQSNSYLRFFSLVYDVAYIMGEAKHGLYNYEVPGSSLPFYWCDMGLSLSPGTDESGEVGLGDYLPQQSGMAAFWKGVQQRFNPPQRANEQYGPLATRAKLGDVAVTAVRMELSEGASLWKDVASSSESPRYEIETGEGIEYYIMTAYYPDKPYYTFGAKTGLKSTAGGARRGLYGSPSETLALHSFVVAVLPPRVLAGITSVGVTGFGVHYDYNTECPHRCGEVKCVCDPLLLDLRLTGNLGKAWTKPTFALPDELIQAQQSGEVVLRAHVAAPPVTPAAGNTAAAGTTAAANAGYGTSAPRTEAPVDDGEETKCNAH